jgi:hypothetical protein
MAELTPLGEPNEYVNLSPTTGPVPLMVKGMPRPGTEPERAPAAAPVGEPPSPAPMVVDAVSADAPDADPTIALTVSSVVPLLETEDDTDLDAEDDTDVAAELVVEADTEPDAGPDAGPDAEPAAIYVDDEVEAEREAERATAVVELDEPDHDADAELDDTEFDDTEIEIEIDDTVVVLDISPRAGGYPEPDDDREPAPVVSLFAGELESRHTAAAEPEFEVIVESIEVEVEVEAEAESVAPEPAPVAVDPDATVALARSSADDLFARLRAARAESVAQRAAEATKPMPRPTVDDTASHATRHERQERQERTSRPAEPAVFQRTDDAPAAPARPADTPFAQRDEALTPLIVAAARKLKRVLADEQNEVLHTLRGKDPVRDVTALVAQPADHAERYAASIGDELLSAAVAGAASMGADASTVRRTFGRGTTTDPARRLLETDVVAPLRERLARCVVDADGDNAELASMVRLVYREWKSQRIDEHLDDIARTAFGRGALDGVAPGTRVCWAVDPNGPECPDAEDNALGGVVRSGEPFPTDHPCAPAHPGCRCMIVPAD